MDAKEFDDIIESIKNNACEEISLTKSLDTGQVQKLADSLSKNISVKMLYLFDTKIGVEGVQILAEKLKHTTLRELILHRCQIRDNGVKALLEWLKTNTTLERLTLSWNEIGDAGTKVIAEILKTNKTIRVLELDGNQIGSIGTKALADILKNNTTLRVLTLNNNQIGDASAKAIADMLKINKTLQILDLTNNQIEDAGIKAFPERLRSNKTLQALSLRGNKIGSAGAKALADLLKNNKIIRIFIAGNKIGDAGVKALAESLMKHNPINPINEDNSDLLDLSANQIGDAGAIILSELLKNNTTIRRLALFNNQIGDIGAKALAELLKTNTTLNSLILSKNQIGDVGARALVERLSINTSLRLELSDNKISQHIKTVIQQALDRNRKLAELPTPTSNSDIAHTSSTSVSFNVDKEQQCKQLEVKTIYDTPAIQFQTLLKKAENGDPDAQNRVGFAYETADGVTQDLKKSIEWFLRAAGQGYSKAQFNMASRYEKGKNVIKNEKIAFELYQKAAEQGHARAQYNLSMMFADGRGIEQDLKKAIEWCQKAANQGHTQAQETLKELSNKDKLLPPKEMLATSPISSLKYISNNSRNLSVFPIATSYKPQQQNESFEVKMQSETSNILPSANYDSRDNEAPSIFSTPDWLNPETLTALQNQTKTMDLLSNLQAFQSNFKESQKQLSSKQEELNRTYTAMRNADGQALSILQGNAESLERLLQGDREEQMAQQERNVILTDDKLSDFYYVFLSQTTDSWLASRTIHSGKVENKEKGTLDHLAKGVDKLGSYISLPGIKLLTDIATKALSFWSEFDRKEGVNRLSAYFGGLVDGDKLIEALGRKLTLFLKTDILNLHPQKTGIVRKALQQAKAIMNKFTANDIDNVFREEAAKYAIQFLMAIMQKKLSPHPSLNDLPLILSTIIGKPYKPSIFTAPQKPKTDVNHLSTSVPTSPSTANMATLSEVEVLRKLLAEQQEKQKAQEEAAKKQAEELKAQQERQKAMERQFALQAEESARREQEFAERLAIIQKQLPKPTEVDGGNEALALENPHASGTNVSMTSFASYQEFSVMKEQLSLVTQTLNVTLEKLDSTSQNVFQNSKKTAAKPVTSLKNILDEKERQQRANTTGQKTKIRTQLADFL